MSENCNNDHDSIDVFVVSGSVCIPVLVASLARTLVQWFILISSTYYLVQFS
jgi:hypothetical protein